MFHVKMKTLLIQTRKWLYLKKYLESRGASAFPWYFSRCSDTSGCSEHLRVAWWGWPELAGLWHIQMWEQTAWLAAIVGVRCFVAVL